MRILNKLVRDKIPTIIENKDEKSVTRILNNSEYETELRKKLQEEVNEFLQDDNCDELADIMEVVYALAKTKDMSHEELEEIRKKKYEERGGFEEKIFLEKVEDK